MKKQKRQQNITRLLAVILLLFMGFQGLHAGESSLKASGDVTANVKNAQACASYMKAIKIWKISIATPWKESKASGKSATAHLFFSRDFALETKTYPIAFNYLNKKDTLGGTFFYRVKGQRIPGFTYDTEGEMTIAKIGDTIDGTFSYTVYTSGRKTPKKSVKVSGTFSVSNKPGFPKGPPPSS